MTTYACPKGHVSEESDFCERARGRVRVLRGVCDALSTPRPLGPLFDIAASVGGELDRLLSARILAYEAADLVVNVDHVEPHQVTQRIIDLLGSRAAS